VDSTIYKNPRGIGQVQAQRAVLLIDEVGVGGPRMQIKPDPS